MDMMEYWVALFCERVNMEFVQLEFLQVSQEQESLEMLHQTLYGFQAMFCFISINKQSSNF